MAGRAPPQSLSIPAFSQHQQGSGSVGSDSFRAGGGRHRSSGGSSGDSSREHSVDSRTERTKGGGTTGSTESNSRAARAGGNWGGNNHLAELRSEGDARGFEGRGWGSSPKSGSRGGSFKWGSGSGSDSPNWRSNRGAVTEIAPAPTGDGSRRGAGRGSSTRAEEGGRRGDSYGRGNSRGSSPWDRNDPPRIARGPGRLSGGKKDPSLDSPTTQGGSRHPNRGLNRQRSGGKNSGWGKQMNGDENPHQNNRHGERSGGRQRNAGGRDGWHRAGDVQDSTVMEHNNEGMVLDEDAPKTPSSDQGHRVTNHFKAEDANQDLMANHHSAEDVLQDEEAPKTPPCVNRRVDTEANFEDEDGVPATPPSQGLSVVEDVTEDVQHEEAPPTPSSLGFRTDVQREDTPKTPSPQGHTLPLARDIEEILQDEEAPNTPKTPKTPPSQGLRADAAEFNPLSARNGFKLPTIVSLRAEAAEYSPETPREQVTTLKDPVTPKDPGSPMTRRSTDWYEICLEEEEEEELQALANKKRDEEFGPQSPQLNSSSSTRGEFIRRKSSLSRNSSGRKLDEQPNNQNNGPPSGKDFARKNSFGRTPNGKKREEAHGSPTRTPGTPKGELRRSMSFGRETAGRDSMGDIQSPNSSRSRFGRRNSFNRDIVEVLPVGSQIASPGSAKGEFKPWNSVREDAADAAQPNRSNAQKSADSRSTSRGDKYVPLALRNKARNEPSNLKPFLNVQDVRKLGDNARNHASPREDGGRRRKGTEETVTTSAAPTAAVVDSPEDSEENGGAESFDQKNINTAVRPAAFFRALNETTSVGGEEPLPHMAGTCPDMCPVKERLQRERLRDLAVFERVNGDLKKTSKELAVKKFCRTVVASELSPADIRPLPVLWRTLQYLFRLLDDPEFPFDIVHNFLFDRTRAIRQELGMQRIRDLQTITIHEEVVRFHILSEHELRELNRKRSKQIDTHLNLQQLSKSLYSLLNLYISLGGEDSAQIQNEAEFHAYYVLLNLGHHGQFQAEPLSLWLPSVPAPVLQAPAMQFARKVLRCYRNNNFVGFFRLVREATYLQSCLMELSFQSLRATSLAMLNVAEYKLHPFPLLELGQLLLIEESQAEELCSYYGLLTGLEKNSEQLCLFAKQSTFTVPERSRLPDHSNLLIDSKRAPTFFEQVKGQKIET